MIYSNDEILMAFNKSTAFYLLENSSEAIYENLSDLKIAKLILDASKEFNKVSIELYKKTIVDTLRKGYILPSGCDASHYNDLFDAAKNTTMEIAYYNYLHSDPGYHQYLTIVLEDIQKEALVGWNSLFTNILNLIKENNISSTFMLLMYPLYSYSEALFINKFQKVKNIHVDIWNIKRIANRQNKLFNEDSSSENELNLKSLVIATTEYFFKNNFEKNKFINRNSVLHGYSPPSDLKIIDFYKLIHYIELLHSINFES
ncbi:hypothetical protein ACTQ45_01830 [Fundicoccus sp. Sow4_D5]|uniref:hypothetical protein n=1 Tax=unclassified Fundicoccus TaxID=2761543 RepID=UPI003F8F644B